MATKVNVSFPGGLCGVLFIVFLVLKLTGHIAWSWWWVTAPLWGPLALIAAFVLFVLFIGVTTSTVQARRTSRGL